MIASPVEPELVERIRRSDENVEVLYDAALLPPPRFPADHRGDPDFVRDPADEARWNEMLGQAQVFYGVPGDAGPPLAAAVARAPHLRWVQGTSAGAGEQVRGARLAPEALERIAFTTAAGVHGAMLAEFSFFGLLALRKDARRLERARAARVWDHFAMGELDGSTIAIVGLGSIGQALAVRARAFGMRTIGVARRPPADGLVDELLPMEGLGEALARCDAVVITLPGTEQTRGLIDRAMLAALKPSAVLINVGRGSVVDQAALVDVLRAKRIAGAVLDVFEPEPLPPENPLWALENVVFCPHTSALSVRENERIVDLFIDNIRRFARGQALRNVVNVREFY